jgi:DNA processing protein
VSQEAPFSSLHDWQNLFLRAAVFQRRQFFKLWNQIRNDPESLEQSLSEQLLRVFEALDLSRDVSLPSDIQFVSWLDSTYPSSLHQLPQPPLGLFVRGALPHSQKCLAVVGSRKPLPFALRMTYRCTQSWVQAGWSIVSGGAYGIDAEAHRAALEASGHTVAVLGGGLHRLYPKAHERLFQSIVEKGGALVSEYPPWADPAPYTFPERNRIIAAMSQGLFLAQAHEKSGSLLTARTALDLGREIYVLHPPPGSEAFRGSQELVEAGAFSLTGPEQLERDYLPRSELTYDPT